MKKKRRSQGAKLPTHTLLNQGESHLTKGQYREAIDVYKQLLKREQKNPQWQESLATAYAGRARQLAAKGMYKEAAALWENRAAVCHTEAELDRYLEWLLRSGRAERAARKFAETDESFQRSPQGQRIGAMLGGLLLSEATEIAEGLPADHVLQRYRQPMVNALQAYCRGDDAGMKECLKQIPYRTPYRDLSRILQVLPNLTTAAEQVREQLDKVSGDSPYAPLAAWLSNATLEGDALLQALRDLTPEPRRLVLTLKGWPAEKIEVVELFLAQRDASNSSSHLFKLVCSRQAMFDKEQAQRFCLALLPDYPQGVKEYERHFDTLPPPEKERLQALAAERNNDIAQALEHWERCVDLLVKRRPKEENKTKAALILRHQADLLMRSRDLPFWQYGPEDYLERSLKWDPDDKDTYLNLMASALHEENIKAHDRWLEQAVKRFPEDPAILMAACAAAYRRKAYKKAVGFARSLLQRDPINQSARNMLLSGHMGHARKQILGRKYQLAEKELDSAREFAQNDAQRGSIGLVQGFLEIARGEQEQGLDTLVQAERQLGADLCAHFRLLVEAYRLQASRKVLHLCRKRLTPLPRLTVGKQDVLHIMEFVRRYLDDDVEDLGYIVEEIHKPLKAAADLDYTEKELRLICDALECIESYDLLRAYAEAGLRRWGERPAFVYFAIYGRTKGWFDDITNAEDGRLHNAMDQAIDEDDQDIIARIEEFVDLLPFGFGDMPLPSPSDIKPPPEVQEVLDELMGGREPRTPQEIEQVIAEIVRRTGMPMPDLPKGRRR